MRYTNKLLTLFFAAFLVIGSAVVSAQAQRRGGIRVYRRPVVVRPYYNRYNSFGYGNYWGNRYFGSPFYGDPYFYDPYLNAQRQRYYLREELRGNKRELQKHLEKYNADGVITGKEREELNDDYRDVEKATRKLREFDGE